MLARSQHWQILLKSDFYQRVFPFADFHLVVIAVLELNNRVHVLVSFFVDDYGALDD